MQGGVCMFVAVRISGRFLLGFDGGLFRLRLHDLLGLGSRSFVLEAGVTLPHSAEQGVPEGEEGLGEVGLDAPALVVDVVVRSIVAGNVLDRVPGQRVSAVVVYGLDCGHDPKHDSLSLGHPCDLIRDTGTECVEQESLQRVVVQCTVGVRNIQSMVPRVEGG